jgi:hypothetical protein
MRRVSTHFEQIAVEVVKKIAIRQVVKNAKVGVGTLIRQPASQKPERDPSRRHRLTATKRHRLQGLRRTSRQRVETV